MKTLDNALSKIEQYFIGIVLLFVAFILFINVSLRAIGLSIMWAEEVARYSIVWVTFIGSSVCIYKGAHIGVDAIMNILKPRGKKILLIVTILMAIVFSVIFTYLSLVITKSVYQMKQESSTLKIPMVYVYSAMPVGGVLMVIRYIQQLFEQFGRRGEK